MGWSGVVIVSRGRQVAHYGGSLVDQDMGSVMICRGLQRDYHGLRDPVRPYGRGELCLELEIRSREDGGMVRQGNGVTVSSGSLGSFP